MYEAGALSRVPDNSRWAYLRQQRACTFKLFRACCPLPLQWLHAYPEQPYSAVWRCTLPQRMGQPRPRRPQRSPLRHRYRALATIVSMQVGPS